MPANPADESKIEGVLSLDKPSGISSARAVARVKRLVPRGTRIGHAGTLDPFATGVLLVLIGKATRLCESLMDAPKQYETTVKFGATTATDDPESAEQVRQDAKAPSIDDVTAALQGFVGQIMQRPPIYSAMKVGGRRAYALARKGLPVELPARVVRVDAIDLVEYAWPLVRLRIDCGRGTYIRSIARDLGEQLHVGGYLTRLRRTRVGPFYADHASTLDHLTAENLTERLARPEQLSQLSKAQGASLPPS